MNAFDRFGSLTAQSPGNCSPAGEHVLAATVLAPPHIMLYYILPQHSMKATQQQCMSGIAACGRGGAGLASPNCGSCLKHSPHLILARRCTSHGSLPSAATITRAATTQQGLDNHADRLKFRYAIAVSCPLATVRTPFGRPCET